MLQIQEMTLSRNLHRCDNPSLKCRSACHPEAPGKLNAELGALSLLPTGFFYADEVKRPIIHIKVAVTVELIESIEASAMLACRPVTNDW